MDAAGQYLLLFILAATPWIEVLLVIPGGLAMGLTPFWVAVVAFAGNALPVFAIVYGYTHWQRWKQSAARPAPIAPSRRKQRALGIWNKYGLPGLALSGPLLTGIHLAVIIALPFNPARKALLLWMNFSLLIWTVAMTAASVLGLEWARAWIDSFTGVAR